MAGKATADPVIEKIIGARLTALSDEELNQITYAHRLGMSAENILGRRIQQRSATHPNLDFTSSGV